MGGSEDGHIGKERKYAPYHQLTVSSGLSLSISHHQTALHKTQIFRLTPQEFVATIKFPLNGDIIVTVGNTKTTQIPVNSNIATAGDKLQGMSKDIIVVNSWNY